MIPNAIITYFTFALILSMDQTNLRTVEQVLGEYCDTKQGLNKDQVSLLCSWHTKIYHVLEIQQF